MGKKRGKLKFDLLVANLQVCDALEHNLHILASPKHQQKKGFTHGQSKHPKAKD